MGEDRAQKTEDRRQKTEIQNFCDKRAEDRDLQRRLAVGHHRLAERPDVHLPREAHGRLVLARSKNTCYLAVAAGIINRECSCKR